MSNPNYSTETLERIKKLERIKSMGVAPFATKYDSTRQIWDINREFQAKINTEAGDMSPFRSVEEVIRRLPLKQIAAGKYEGDLFQDKKFEQAINAGTLQILHVKLETNEWRLTGDWLEPLQRNLRLSPLP